MHLNLTLLNSLFKGADVPTKVGRTFTGARELFWPDVLPAAADDSYGYQRELKPGLRGARVQVRHLNHEPHYSSSFSTLSPF